MIDGDRGFLGNDQRVPRTERGDVEKRQHPFVLVQLVARDLAAQDLAEDGVRHARDDRRRAAARATDDVGSPMTAPPMTGPLSIWTKLAYGVGQLAEGVKNTAFSVFLLFYYNQVLGLPGTWTGVALGLATVTTPSSIPSWDRSPTASAIAGGAVISSCTSPPSLAVSFALLFFPPAGLGQGALFAGCSSAPSRCGWR